MTNFQLGSFVLLAIVFAITIAAGVKHRLTPRLTFVWAALWIAAAIAIARPEITVAVAHSLGIARGADLIFYLGILTMLAGFFAVYLKFRRLESDLTRLVREIALASERRPEVSGESAPRADG